MLSPSVSSNGDVLLAGWNREVLRGTASSLQVDRPKIDDPSLLAMSMDCFASEASVSLSLWTRSVSRLVALLESGRVRGGDGGRDRVESMGLLNGPAG